MQTGITDAEARVKAKALDVFKFWLLAEKDANRIFGAHGSRAT
jgi:hypothetical protein